MPTTIPALPAAPQPTDTRSQFSAKSFAFNAALGPWTTAANQAGAEISTAAAQVATDAATATAQRLAVDANTALVASYANAQPWAAGTYALGAVVSSTVNRRLYSKITASSATALDPSTDPTNWALANAFVPFSAITSATFRAVNGGRYSVQASTAEGAGTNLLLYSDQLDNAAWVKTGCTVTASAAMAPDGTQTANLITNTGGTNSFAAQSLTVPASTTNDYWAWACFRKDNSPRPTLNVFYAGNAHNNVIFDLDAGTASGVPYAGEYRMDYLGGGWYRCGYRITRDATGARTSIGVVVWESTFTQGIAGNRVYTWRLELSPGSSPTSYIPSGATTGTRAAGQVPGQRMVLPAGASEGAYVCIQVGNGSYTNVIDPDGATIENLPGPLLLDVGTGAFDLQKLNGTWRLVG